MNRKSVLLGLGLLLVVTGSVSAGLVLLIRNDPDYYLRCAIPPGVERQKHSREFQSEFSALLTHCMNHYDDEWTDQFTQEQINSYFQEEDFVRSGTMETVLPEGVRAPRVAIEPDKIRLAFRYGSGAWSTIISIDIRVWLTKEPNVVALELQSLHAGALPISAQSLLQQLSETAQQNHIEVTWYRYRNGNPVALLRFQADRPRPTVQLRRLELHKGLIVIGGQSIEGSPSHAAGEHHESVLKDLFGLDTRALQPSAN
jgi:hypothetical protein